MSSVVRFSSCVIGRDGAHLPRSFHPASTPGAAAESAGVGGRRDALARGSASPWAGHLSLDRPPGWVGPPPGWAGPPPGWAGPPPGWSQPAGHWLWGTWVLIFGCGARRASLGWKGISQAQTAEGKLQGHELRDRFRTRRSTTINGLVSIFRKRPRRFQSATHFSAYCDGSGVLAGRR